MVLNSVAFRYNLGNLIRKQSEPFDAKEHEEKHARVEKLSRAAVAIAHLARRVASLMQVASLYAPLLLTSLSSPRLLCISHAGHVSPLSSSPFDSLHTPARSQMHAYAQTYMHMKRSCEVDSKDLRLTC